MRNLLLKILSFILLFSCPFSFANNIPVAPVNVMNISKLTSSEAKSGLKGNVISVKNGVNELISIGIGHANRIVTPFSSPSVLSSSLDDGSDDDHNALGKIKIQDNVIYVTTEHEYPITMFIREEGSEQRAINITLVPKKIPPREVVLKFNDDYINLISVSKKAQAWETSQPYVETIKNLFISIARNEIPQGYSIGKVKSGQYMPSCNQVGIVFDFAKGQLLNGHNLVVYIGVAKNISNKPIEFNEASCANIRTAAVTAWPNHVLEKGQTTEIYVAVKQQQYTNKNSSKFRPSLIMRNK